MSLQLIHSEMQLAASLDHIFPFPLVCASSDLPVSSGCWLAAQLQSAPSQGHRDRERWIKETRER